MADLFHGGDKEWPNTPNSPNKTVGGSGDITNITEAEIAVIVITVVGLIVALVTVFYCRILRVRRDIDMENKARGCGEDRFQGGCIELRGQKRVSGGTCDTAVDKDDKFGLRPGTLRSNAQKKSPLRHYIHWKNPHQETLPRRLPRDSIDDGPTIPSPAYFV